MGEGVEEGAALGVDGEGESDRDGSGTAGDAETAGAAELARSDGPAGGFGPPPQLDRLTTSSNAAVDQDRCCWVAIGLTAPLCDATIHGGRRDRVGRAGLVRVISTQRPALGTDEGYGVDVCNHEGTVDWPRGRLACDKTACERGSCSPGGEANASSDGHIAGGIIREGLGLRADDHTVITDDDAARLVDGDLTAADGAWIRTRMRGRRLG